MAKKKKGQETEVDMTPMIDCVFLLIIFFVVSTQIVTDVIPLEPPFAINLNKDKLDDKKIVVNVNELGVHIGGKHFDTWQDFKRELEIRATQGEIKDNFSEMVLYIRGDTVSQWKYIQEVLAIANECTPKIYKTDFAAQLESLK